MNLLNLGCGKRVHPQWRNVDRVAAVPGVLVLDVRRGLPFPDGSFDAVYHSHLLEHLTRHEARALTLECVRVLAPGGILRVAVPDLERIAREYLDALQRARANQDGSLEELEWMGLELVDQLSRHESGGEIRPFLERCGGPAARLARRRWGAEVCAMASAAGRPGAGVGLLERLRSAAWAALPAAWRVGTFRVSGEVHRWMYDDVSLGALLRGCGLEGARTVGPLESGIASWDSYGLDADASGAAHKPDSLYMEAMRPQEPVR